MKFRTEKLNANMVVFVVAFLIACTFFATCEVIAQNTCSGTENTPVDTVQKEKVAESWEEYNASNLPLIASIPDKEIYLYGIKPSGVVLYVKDTGSYFDWYYITPRLIFPRMYIGDFDADGKEELAVILYTGSGTGFAIEDLHIVEIAEDEMILEESSGNLVPNPAYFSDHLFRPESYLSQLNEEVKLNTYYKNDELMADIAISGKISTVSLKELQETDPQISVNNMPCFGNIVYFNHDNGKLSAKFALGVTSNSFATPYFIGEVDVDVVYSGGSFKLANMVFRPDALLEF